MTLTSKLATFPVSRETIEKLEIYKALLLKWQRAKNLIAPSTIPDLDERHFIDSAQMLTLFENVNNAIIIDIGSGAGFPGLVLSLLGEGRLNVHMVESNGKKASFLKTVIRETGAPATVHQQRVEEMEAFPADFITARACATIQQLLDWSSPFCTERTICHFLKGQKWQEELTEAQSLWTMTVSTKNSQTEKAGKIISLSDIGRLS